MSDRFPAPIDRVEQAVLDPSYQQRLSDLPNVDERRVLEQEAQPDGTVRRVVLYRFKGSLPSAVRRALGTSDISWDEISRFSPADHEWRFQIRPHVFADRFRCSGVYRFTPNGTGTRRDVSVELEVRVPVVGRRVESVIADGLVENLRAEGRILRRFLEERP